MRYLVTPEGILKMIHIILGFICLGLLCNNFSKIHFILTGWELFMHITNATFLITCVILFATNLFDVSSNELLYNAVATLFNLVASIGLLAKINGKYSDAYHVYRLYDNYIAVGVLGLLNAVLFFASGYINRNNINARGNNAGQ